MKRSSTGRPRGRPPKKTKKEDFDPSDTSESEVEDALPEEAEQSSGDENDPEWRVGQKNDVPKRFKTVGHSFSQYCASFRKLITI